MIFLNHIKQWYFLYKQFFFKENVRDPMIIFSDSRDPIFNSNRVPKMPLKNLV